MEPLELSNVDITSEDYPSTTLALPSTTLILHNRTAKYLRLEPLELSNGATNSKSSKMAPSAIASCDSSSGVSVGASERNSNANSPRAAGVNSGAMFPALRAAELPAAHV